MSKQSSDETPSQQVPLSELQEALTSEGAKDYRIENLEAALDWAMGIVMSDYDEGECPKALFEELERSRLRVVAADSPETTSDKQSSDETTGNDSRTSNPASNAACRLCLGEGEVGVQRINPDRCRHHEETWTTVWMECPLCKSPVETPVILSDDASTCMMCGKRLRQHGMFMENMRAALVCPQETPPEREQLTTPGCTCVFGGTFARECPAHGTPTTTGNDPRTSNEETLLALVNEVMSAQPYTRHSHVAQNAAVEEGRARRHARTIGLLVAKRLAGETSGNDPRTSNPK